MGRRAQPGEAAATTETPKTVNGDSGTEENGATTDTSTPSAPLTTAQRLAASNTAAANAEVPPDPYAREAKHFTEIRVLNKDVSCPCVFVHLIEIREGWV